MLLIIPICLLVFVFILPAIASADDKVNLQLQKARLEIKRQEIKQQDSLNEKLKLQNQYDIELRQNAVSLGAEDLRNKQKALAIALSTNESTQEQTDQLKKAIAVQARFLAEEKKKTEELAKQIAMSDRAAERTTEALSGITGVTEKWKDTILGSFIQGASKGEGFSKTLTKVRASTSDLFSATNILGSGMMKLVEATIAVAGAQDEAMSSFIRATGATSGYDTMIQDTFVNNRALGVSIEEATAAAGSLYIEMSAFSTLAPRVQSRLLETTALMSELGISTDSAAQAMDYMTRSLGMSALEAADMSEELINTAERIGVPPARLMQELSATAPQLAKWGSEAIDIFIELEGASKATGIAVGNLIGIAAQYDTFESAAESAGRLNAMLGGPYLNSIELLNANEEERIRMLIESVSLTGRSWEEMGRFEKQAVASAAGISDMSEANRIFGMTLSEYDRAQSAAEANAAAQKELHDRAIEAQSVFETMQNVMNSFAITIRPIVLVLKEVMQALSGIVSLITGNPIASWLAGITIAAWLLLTPVGKIILAVTAITYAFNHWDDIMKKVKDSLQWISNIFTIGHSPTFPEYIGIAADNMANFTAAASATTSTLRANSLLSSAATGNASARMESGRMSPQLERLIKATEESSRKQAAGGGQDIVLQLNGREMARATKSVINREMAINMSNV